MKNRIVSLLATLAALLTLATPVSANTEQTYGDYSLMFQRSAGQYWAQQESTATGQWTWNPSGNTSVISWGPAESWQRGGDWAQVKHEQFAYDGGWVWLDGFRDSVSFYELRTMVEWTADADCQTNRVALVPGGAQRYVKWTVDSRPYCLFAAGTLRQVTTGKLIAFAHQQVWSRETCANRYLGQRLCLKQRETWWDDNGSPWQVRQDRTQWIGRGAGMGYVIAEGAFRPELRYTWLWG